VASDFGMYEPVFCVFISLDLWLESNLKLNPKLNPSAAIASPYVFSFSNDVTMPGGGQKAKDIAQSIFGQHVFKPEELVFLLHSTTCPHTFNAWIVDLDPV
jgi:hypothetical protein